MTIIIIILSLLLVGSATFTIYLLRKMMFFSENLNNLVKILRDYSEHLEKVYNSEVFYGDETLQELLKHSQDVVGDVLDFSAGYEDAINDKKTTKN